MENYFRKRVSGAKNAEKESDEEKREGFGARPVTCELCNGSIFKLLRTAEGEKNAVIQKKWKNKDGSRGIQVTLLMRIMLKLR